jgi:formylglycine-generating enzyme required for sulfatase activity
MNTYWYYTVAPTPYDASKGPTAYTNSSSRVVRGGSWVYDTVWVRAASRIDYDPADRGSYYDIGFRAARTP